MNSLGGAGFLFAMFWPILVPVFYFALCVQIFLAHRWCVSPPLRILVRTTMTLEFLAPALALLLYPLMPGSTWAGEPLGMSEKAGNTAGATGVVCVALFSAAILLLVGARVTLQKTSPTQRSS